MLTAALPLLLALAAPAAGEPPAKPARPAKARYRIFDRAPAVLSEAETARLRSEVLQRCHLRLDTDPARAPWYFHYELGKELDRRGDPQQALDAFIESALRREKPRKGARVYGMWFTDYYPYFHIARTHARLENWDCAADALAVSEVEGEMADRRQELAELRELVVGHTKEAPRR